jgi:hypothetical protein
MASPGRAPRYKFMQALDNKRRAEERNRKLKPRMARTLEELFPKT